MLFDILKRPIKVGDTVLVKGYYSFTTDTQAIVTKVAKVNVYMDLQLRKGWNFNPVTKQYEAVHSTTTKRMARRPSECIVIDHQLTTNRNEYPEYYL